MQVRVFSYLLLSCLWAVLTWTLGREFAVGHFWVVVASVLLFSLPIALSGLYTSTVQQVRRLAIFTERGWIFRLFSGRSLRALCWLLWALVTAFFMLVQFHTWRPLEWGLFFLVIPVFLLVFSFSRRLLARELRPYIVTGMALAWARLLCPLLMLALFFGFSLWLGDHPAHASLQAAVEAQRAGVADMQGSALAQEVARYLAFYDGLKVYALGRLGAAEALGALALAGVLHLVVFYNACAMLSCFLIPTREYRRVFGPLSDAERPPRVSPGRTALLTAVATFVILFIYLPLFAYLEAWVQQRPPAVEALRTVEARVMPRLEQIDQAYFREGTLAGIDQARVDALRQMEVSLTHLEERADQAFIRMEANVDIWLDWYYSLVGEYARIAHLMTGELESYMVAKLEESLRQGDAFAEVQAALNQALAGHEEASRLYRARVEAIMAENRVIEPPQPVEVVQRASLGEVLSPPVHEDMIGLRDRLVAGGGGAAVAGVVTAVVVKKVIGKVVGKNIFKLASKSLAKVVVGKTAGSVLGAGAGAAAGAAAGSVVPGIGTAIGAVIGGIAGGIAVGLTVDKMLIELEEAISREEFRQEILLAIREARDEFRALLRNQQSAP